DDAVLARLVIVSRQVRYSPGQRLVSELESGADVYGVLSGEAEGSGDARDGHRHVLSKLGPGSAFGAMSALTGGVRAATGRAISDVEALVIADADFDRLREERPEVALKLVRELASRLRAAEASLEALLLEAPPVAGSAAPQDTVKREKGSIARAWRELVVARK